MKQTLNDSILRRGTRSAARLETARRFMVRSAATIVLAAAVFTGPHVNAQDSAYLEWVRQEQLKFERFRNAQDSAFSGMLDRTWIEVRGGGEEPLHRRKKIERPPVYGSVPTSPAPPSSVREPAAPREVPRTPASDPSPGAPAAASVRGPMSDAPSAGLAFFGTPIPYRADPSWKALRPPVDLNDQGIREWWIKASATAYEPMIEEIRRQAGRAGLNDWGFVRLAWETGRSVSAGDRTTLPLFTWFVLIQSGKDARIAYNRTGLHLLVSVQEKLYAKEYFQFDQKRYYVVDFDGSPGRLGSIRTYEGQHAVASADVSMAMTQVPLLSGRGFEHRVLRFSYEGVPIEFPVRVRKPRIDYFGEYPQTELEIFFNTPLPAELREDIGRGLAPHLAGRSQTESVNVLLRFVQTAFDYATDEEQFGKEKHLIPEEMVWHPYSDCEDRSFLFARLAKELLGLEVIGLHYPGHVATAVRLEAVEPGDDVVRHEGVLYSVADPTYMHADVGVEMPRYKGSERRVVRIDS